MGRDLGELGTPKDDLDVTFTYFGAEMRIHPTLSELAIVDFMEAAAAVQIPDDGDLTRVTPQMQAALMQAMPMIKGFLRAVVHPDDFDALWTSANAHRQGLEDLMRLAHNLIAKVTDRPTGRRPGSSGTPRRTGRKSAAGSSSPVMRQLEKRGRPDLALIVAETAAARQASAASG